MKITLTNPYNPGDHDKGKTYPHVFVEAIHNDRKGENIVIDYAYGTVTNKRKACPTGGFLFDSAFERGFASPVCQYNVQGDEYLALKSSSITVPGDTVYEACLRLMYQALLSSNSVIGKIVNP